MKNMSKRHHEILNKRAKSVYGKTLSKLDSAERYYIEHYKEINAKYKEVDPSLDSTKPQAQYGKWWKQRVEMTQMTKKRGLMRKDKAVEKVVNSDFLTPEAIRSKLNLGKSLKQDWKNTYDELKLHLTGGKRMPYRDIHGRFTSFEKSTLVANGLEWDERLRTFTFISKLDGRKYQIITRNSPKEVFIQEVYNVSN